VTETTVKRLVCCGFRRTGKAMGQVYQCWWRICRGINVFPRSEYNIIFFLYPFMTYILILPHTYLKILQFSPTVHLGVSVTVSVCIPVVLGTNIGRVIGLLNPGISFSLRNLGQFLESTSHPDSGLLSLRVRTIISAYKCKQTKQCR
jgi:hypothetical protein